MDILNIPDIRRDFQVVKCVVVGDSGVGKTRLICARACNTKYNLQQLMQTSVPTVWAIDHYRNDKKILDQSWCTVDSINVSLRLWDTFGYHDKDRRFAYGRADVILVCYSVVRPRSLRNVINHWHPEIRRLCPGVPIVLCGTQIDLRYLCLTEDFIELDKGPFFREIHEEDILTPEQGRKAAKEIQATYYETSVLEPFGVDEVFENVVRAALINKRDKQFWSVPGSALRRINKLTCQKPHMPPKPPPPKIKVPPSEHAWYMRRLLDNQCHCDVVFQVQGVTIPAHRAVLLVASSVFKDILTKDFTSQNEEQCTPRSASEQSQQPANCGGVKRSNSQTAQLPQSDTATLLDHEELDVAELSEEENATDTQTKAKQEFHLLNHPVFYSIQLCSNLLPGTSCRRCTVIALHENIDPILFKDILIYIYTGLCTTKPEELHEMEKTAELFGLSNLACMARNMQNNEAYLNPELTEVQSVHWQTQVKQDLLQRRLCADVIFELDDGLIPAHKPLLVASCDVMAGMFSSSFRECSADVIHFPGTTCESFLALLEFLYTGECPDLSNLDLTMLLELANRLCLPRLIAMIETFVVSDMSSETEDLTETVLLLLEAAQMHNATELAGWCLWYLSTNYCKVHEAHSKLLQCLRPDNQVYLSKHRWPASWYLKENEYYEKCLVDQARENRKTFLRRSSEDIDGGCLGFCSRRNRRMNSDSVPPSTALGACSL